MLEPYQGQSLRVDYTLGILYEKARKKALSHFSFGRYFYRTENYPASLFHIETALKDKGDLPREVVEELTTMQDMIGKKQQGRQ